VLAVGTRNVPLAAPSHPPRIVIAGHMAIKWHVPIQSKHVCTHRRGTKAKQQRPTIWEGPKSTGIDFQGRHLKIIMKNLNTMRHPLLTQVAQGTFFCQMLQV
jgi:hypothetical protein